MDSEQDGTGANGRHLAPVGGTDGDRIAIRSAAAAALGFLEAGRLDETKGVLRRFLA